ncbi:uncharacterized protein DUF4245 [Tamaricihabitans halophyticus]|uniref:Uncharacterized protein DUF4245 n=2 Tax=Tamaricihabitans halophyticus TaxID=1262583 RepID=A0A4R2R1B0_9PSEU|nr:uncharacterized protein DUF4245 [Tamaricihabitans halophyticus]
MIFSVLALVAIIGVVVLFTRGCEFSPGGPSIDQGAAPTVNARTELNRMAERVDFPIRQPELPAGWRANSARTTQLGTGAGAPVLAEIGWLTPDGAYLRLVQSEASTEELVDEVAGKAGAGADSEGTVRSGSVGSDDLLWDVYPGKDDQQTWVLKLPEVRVLISGSASGKEFGELADAVEAADDNVAVPSAGR